MEHTEKHLKSSEFLTDMVIGMSDGLTVPFALAAGLSGAVSSNGIIITAGVAEIVAGSIANHRYFLCNWRDNPFVWLFMV